MADISDPSWNETDGNNTNGPPLGWPPNMPANQVEPTSRAMMGAIKRFWDRTNATITTTGPAGTYIWTPGNVAFPVVFSQGESYAFRAHQASIGGDVFNPNGLGAKPFYKAGATAPTVIQAGDINAGQMYTAFYDGTLGGTGAFQVLSGALPTAIRGNITGNNAPDGIVGEYRSSVILVGNAIQAAATNTPQDITSLPLDAGDWDIWGELWLSCNVANTIAKSVTWVNTLSAIEPPDVGDQHSRASFFPNSGITGFQQFAGMAQNSTASGTTYYLGSQLQYTGASNLILLWGKLCARRRR